MSITTTARLEAFLIEKGALHEFMHNALDYWPEGKEWLDDIGDSFLWHMTDEGYDFWADLSEEYDLLINEVN